MYFKIDTRKAIEAAATLLRLSPHRTMDRKRLLALLYLADRECLKRAGRPIVGGRLAAMKWGPIHSEIYDLIKGGKRDQVHWSRHFQNEEYRIRLAKDVGVCALSRYEIDLLNEISDRYAALGTWDVADATHAFEEYQKNYQEGTSTPIELVDVLDAIGRKKQKTAILEDARAKAYFDKLFAGEE